MTISQVKSYVFPTGGLRAMNAYGPTTPKPNNLGQLLSAVGITMPTSPYSTNIASVSGAAPSAKAQQQVVGGQPFAPPTPDQLSNDPILQQIRAAGQQSIAQARSGALAAAESDLVGYGATNVPASIKALYASDASNPILAALTDANTQQAAAANPDSTLHQLAATNVSNNAGIDTGENANNLYYSSDRANKLGAEATTYRQAQDTAAQNLGALLGQANSGVLQAENQASSDYLNGLQGAWDRWLSMQQLLGPTPTGTSAPGPNTGLSGIPFTVSDTSSPSYGQPNPLFTQQPDVPGSGSSALPKIQALAQWLKYGHI